MKFHKLKFKFLFSGFFLVTLIAGCNSSGTRAKNKEFVKIFDGKSMNGWEGDSTYWSVKNGILVGQITPSTLLEQNTFLIWKEGEPADFELKAEFHISADGNSGINYRSESVESVPYALKGYQADIDGKNNYTGQSYEERGRTTLAYRGQKVVVKLLNDTTESLKDNVKNNAWSERTVVESLGGSDSLATLIEKEGWNEIHLIVKNNRMQHFINGVLMSDVTDNDSVHRKFSGKIGVQVHVGPPMKVEYRNIQLKQL